MAMILVAGYGPDHYFAFNIELLVLFTKYVKLTHDGEVVSILMFKNY